MIKKHIKIAVDIPTTDKENKLLIEPGIGDVVILSEGSGLRVGVDRKVLIDALYEIDFMKKRYLPDEEEKAAPEVEIGAIIEGDEDFPF